MDFQVIVSGVPVSDEDGEKVQVAFTSKPRAFWIRKGQDNWQRNNDQDLRMFLKACNVSPSKSKEETISEMEQALLHITRNNRVDFALNLAGYKEGRLESDGHVILITRGTTPLPGTTGDWTHLKNYVRQLLGEEGFEYQMSWWKWARRSFAASATLPGQAMIYVGASGIGKSFLQKITTQLLGGRAGDPFRYMTNRSSFNSDLFTCQHLVIEDQFADSGGKGRREFGARLKELVVNQVVSCHAKGADALTLRPKWRLSMSMNDEREHLEVLPPFDQSLLDKIMLFQCQPPEFPFDLSSDEGWKLWDEAVTKELPALAQAVDDWEIPARLRSARYGVKSWHDPVLLSQEEESSVENQFLDVLVFDLKTIEDGEFWQGSSNDLERVLLGASMPSINTTRRLLSWKNATGTYLGRLASKHPDVVTCRKRKGINQWRIQLK